MKILITESQVEKLRNPIQQALNFELRNIKKESEDWGMGEMDELHEIGAVDKIKIDRIESGKVLEVYVNIYISYPRYDFENTLNEIEDRIRTHFPKINLIENEILFEKTSGPGIDW